MFTLHLILPLVTAGMILVLGSALWFEHFLGYVPCDLCLKQRIPYYIGIPVLLLGTVSLFVGLPTRLVRFLLLIGLLCLVTTIMLGVYHAGIEWKFWAGPASCASGSSGEAGDAATLLSRLADSVPPSCDEAAGRFLGISFAGWNVLSAAVLAYILARGFYGSRGVSQYK